MPTICEVSSTHKAVASVLKSISAREAATIINYCAVGRRVCPLSLSRVINYFMRPVI